MIHKEIENTSKIYFNGSIWDSNTCGEFEIIGKIGLRDTYGKFSRFLCKFKDDTCVIAYFSNIKQGKVKNPNHPTVLNIGFIGEGCYKSSIKSKDTVEYCTWRGILDRCFNKKSKFYKFYGGIGVTVDKRWYNFQRFCEDLQELEGYDQWKLGDCKYELDKDIMCNRLNITPKIYSKNTCMFVTRKENLSEMAKRCNVTGLTYIGFRELDNLTAEFTNQHEFSRIYGLNVSHVCSCIKKKRKIHKGWTFKIKEEL